MTLIDVYNIYQGSDGEATKALYARLEALGPIGALASNVFRAHKSSGRAKVYRGGEPGRGSYRSMGYERKQWALENIARILGDHAGTPPASQTPLEPRLAIGWGWAIDPAQEFHRWVLYVDLPTGQVSFHTSTRGAGPDYAAMWDGSRDEGAGRICRWIAQLLAEKVTA